MPEVLDAPPRKPGMFTAETARKAAAASVASRQAAAQRPKPEPIPVAAPLPTVTPTAPTDDFTVRKLASVRDQIERVELLLTGSDEPQAVDRFANALTRLYDLERILAGRPLPGSRRPAPDGKRDRQAPRSFAPSAAEAPTVPQTEPKPLNP